MTDNSNDMFRFTLQDREIILLGTAHVSRESARLVTSVIEKERPDTVCVELCLSRYQTIEQKNKWQDTDIIKVIKEKKVFLLLSNLLLTSFQKRVAKKFDILPGQEMIQAIETGRAVNAEIYLADRDIRITLARIWRTMGIWGKLKLLVHFVASVGDIEDITPEAVEEMKQQDMLQTLLEEIGKSLPQLKSILIDERDQYLSHKIKTAPGRKIVAVVGAGHVPGIKKFWDQDTDLEKLETLPPKRKGLEILKWVIPSLILAIFVVGFFWGGSQTGAHMLTWWILANGILAGLGALIALAHPVTILSAVVAAPLTSLNPMVAAGWVSGLVETVLRKPKVKDFEALPDDILSVKGFWKNKITRILLVVVFTNLGSTLGTMVAIPLLLKLL
ncbi:MAG: TraB/GumN family protein [Desulfobacterales bacterium]|nr:TraB/GumN family protein [Desulfobacterales bacterium]